MQIFNGWLARHVLNMMHAYNESLAIEVYGLQWQNRVMGFTSDNLQGLDHQQGPGRVPAGYSAQLAKPCDDHQ